MALNKQILQAYKIGNYAVGTEIDAWDDIPQSKPAFKWADSLDAEYKDITSIKNIYKFRDETGYDFQFNRNQIELEVINIANDALGITLLLPPLTPTLGQAHKIAGPIALGSWAGKEGQIAQWNGSAWIYFAGDNYTTVEEQFGVSLLTDNEEKEICASLLIGTIAQKNTIFYNIYGLENYIDKLDLAYSNFQDYMSRCRELRFKKAVTLINTHIAENFNEVMLSITMHESDRKYIQYRYNGLAYGDQGGTGLSDYILGQGSFNGNGLINQSWITIDNRNMTEFSNELIDLLFETGIKK